MNTKQVAHPPKAVQVRLKQELHAWVHLQAQTQDRSANWIINKVLEEACARTQQQTAGAQQ